MSCENCGSDEETTVCQGCIEADSQTWKALRSRLFIAERNVRRRDATIAELRAMLVEAREYVTATRIQDDIDALLERTKP